MTMHRRSDLTIGIEVTVRFDDPEAERPVALTVAALRPDLFRIAVESAESPLPPSGEHVFPTASSMEDLQP